MFLQNDVLEYAGAPARAVRILWIDPGGALAYVFELKQASALPQAVATAALAADVAARRARLLLADPYAAVPPGPAANKHRRLQMKAWDAVRSLHAGLPALYRQRERAALVAACAEAHGVSKASIMRYLRRYWERGQTLEALLPDYLNSGAPGRTRAASAGIKRGRPRKDALPGTNADAAMRAIFRAAAARYAVAHGSFSQRAAYRQMLEEFFCGCEAGELPSFGQFAYWVEREAMAPALPAPPGASGPQHPVPVHGASAPPSRCIHTPEWCGAAK